MAQRVKQLEDHVGGPQVQDQARVLEMMKGLSSGMDAVENRSSARRRTIKGLFARKVKSSQSI